MALDHSPDSLAPTPTGAPPSPAVPAPESSSESDNAAAVAHYCPLDPNVVNLWRIQKTISYSFVLVFVLMAATVATWKNVPFRWVIIPWGCFAALLFGWAIWYPRRSYRGWGYRIEDKVLLIRHGVWFKTIRLLPLTRLQHVDLHQGPIERQFGLSTLLLYTAGTQHAMLSIPGLRTENAVRLRDELAAVGGDDGV